MGTVRVRNYQQAHWDEPIIFELSTPGVRGILPPEPEPEIVMRHPSFLWHWVKEGFIRNWLWRWF